MSMSRKDYETVASEILLMFGAVDSVHGGANGNLAIWTACDSVLRILVGNLGRTFQADNPQFRKDLFVNASIPPKSEPVIVDVHPKMFDL